MIDALVFTIATGFGIGLLEPVRSVLATAVVAAIYLAIPVSATRWRIGTLLAFTLVGFFAAESLEQASGLADDGRIIIDEMAGAALLFTLFPVRRLAGAALLGLAFVILDGLKPWPISVVERWPQAWGVMGDDMVLALFMGLALLAARALSAHFRKVAITPGSHPRDRDL